MRLTTPTTPPSPTAPSTAGGRMGRLATYHDIVGMPHTRGRDKSRPYRPFALIHRGPSVGGDDDVVGDVGVVPINPRISRFLGSLGSSSMACWIASLASSFRPRWLSAIARLPQLALVFGRTSVDLRAAISHSDHLPCSARHQVSSSQASPFIEDCSRTERK